MSKVKAILIALLSLVLVVSFISCDGNQKTPDDPVPTPTPAPEPEAKAPAKVVFATNMMADDPNLGYAIEGDFPTTVAMSGDSYIDKDGAIHGTFYLVDDSEFTAFWGKGKTEKRYYACYNLIVDDWKAADDNGEGNYLAYVKTSYSGDKETVEYGKYNGLDFCTVLGSNADDIKKLKIEYYVVEGNYERIKNTETKPAGFDDLIKEKKPITITISSDAKFEEQQPARITFVAGMMGDEYATETAEGDVSALSAMSQDTYIDSDGAIHGTFSLVDNSKFTAFWGEGKTGKSYYVCYDLVVDDWKAADDNGEGNYLAYVKTSYSGDKETVEYGKYNGLDFCTVLGSNADDIKKLKIEYYVVEGNYKRIKNTETKPDGFDNLIKEKKPITITIADDAVFNK